MLCSYLLILGFEYVALLQFKIDIWVAVLIFVKVLNLFSHIWNFNHTHTHKKFIRNKWNKARLDKCYFKISNLQKCQEKILLKILTILYNVNTILHIFQIFNIKWSTGMISQINKYNSYEILLYLFQCIYFNIKFW